jgi:hypothetical protein
MGTTSQKILEICVEGKVRITAKTDDQNNESY